MSKFKQYAGYKESGIEWTVKIPSSWNTVKAGFVYDITLGKMIQTEKKKSTDKLVPYLKANNVQDNFINYKTVDYMYASEAEVEKYRLKESDLLVCEGGEVARSAFMDKSLNDCIFQNALHRVRSTKQGNLGYLHYILNVIRHSEFINILVNRATIAHFTRDKFSSLRIPLPSSHEQKNISDILDRKTSEINSLISDKERLIELLEEKRQAVITETVTKGLDPNVKMKDSGIEWIGEIPEHWESIKLNYLTSLRSRKASVDSKLPYLGLENVSSMTGQIIKFNTTADIDGGALLFFKSDILFGKLRPYLMKCVVAPEDGRCTTEFLVIKTKKQVLNNKYLKYMMLSTDFIEKVNSSTYGAKMPRANWDFIRNLFIPLPSYQDQVYIVESIEGKLQDISIASKKIREQISKLKEYRESLIYEAVTGKIDVREYVSEIEEVH